MAGKWTFQQWSLKAWSWRTGHWTGVGTGVAFTPVVHYHDVEGPSKQLDVLTGPVAEFELLEGPSRQLHAIEG